MSPRAAPERSRTPQERNEPVVSHSQAPVDAAAQEPHWLTAEEREAWLCLSAVMFQLPGQLENQLQKESGLGFVEYLVLAMLSESPHTRLSMSELSTQTNTRAARLSRVVKRLEEDGLVQRTTSETDKRVSICHLTDAGLQKVREAAPGHVDQVRRSVFNHLTKRQVSQLASIGEALLGGKPSSVIAAQLANSQNG